MAGAPSSGQGSVYMHPAQVGHSSPQQCLFNLESYWMAKDVGSLQRTLDQVLYTTDPRSLHGFILQTLEGSHDMRRKKPDSMALVVLKQFEHWCTTHPHIMTPQVLSVALTEDLKREAFSMADNAHANIFDLLCRIYHLNQPGNEFLVPHVKSLISKHMYKEAAYYAAKLKLQNYFTLDEICLPLLLQDKCNLAENYVRGNETMQLALVQSLDQYCYKGFDAGMFLDELKIPNARREKLRPQNLSKLIMRLVKLFKLNPEVCPNTCHAKDYGAMKYLLYKKYVECSFGTTVPSNQKPESDNWGELMENTIRNNTELQEELVSHLQSYNDLTAAAEWSQRFDIPIERLNPAVIAERERLKEEASNKPPKEESDDWDDECYTEAEMTYPPEQYYRLSIAMDKVHFINTLEGLQTCQNDLCEPGRTVGIDMEWRPTFTPTQVTRVALVQLATHENIYLLDMIALQETGQYEVIKTFFTALLCGKEVIKLGFGIKTDFQMLHKSYPYLRECVSNLRRVVDLHTLSRQIVYALPDIMGEAAPASEAESVAAEKGLRELVHQCLGKPLDKKEQLSDWERRPLRLTQIHYAALDAFCLLEIYDLLNARVKAAELEINMEPSLSSKPPAMCNQPRSSRSANRKEARDRKKNSSSPNSKHHPKGPSLRPGEVAVVCDNMLQGLGRYLRACGIDVKILANEDDHDVAAKIAREESRIILTAGMPYQTLKSYVGEGRCLSVSSMGKAREQAIEVLERLNIKVSPKDVFSRCQVCNGNLYVKVPSADLHQMWIRKQELLRQGKSVFPGWNTVSQDSRNNEGAFSFPETQAALEDIAQAELHNAPEGVSSGARPKDGSFPNPSAAPSVGSASRKDWKAMPDGDDDDYDDGFDDGLELYCDDDGYDEERDSPPPPTIFRKAEPIKVASSQANDWGTWEPITNSNPPPGFESLPITNSNPPPGFESFENQPQKDSSSLYCPPSTSSPDAIDYQRQIVGEAGVPIEVEALAEGVFSNVQVFYVCATCGKVFWEGKHFERILTQFREVFIIDDEKE